MLLRTYSLTSLLSCCRCQSSVVAWSGPSLSTVIQSSCCVWSRCHHTVIIPHHHPHCSRCLQNLLQFTTAHRLKQMRLLTAVTETAWMKDRVCPLPKHSVARSGHCWDSGFLATRSPMSSKSWTAFRSQNTASLARFSSHASKLTTHICDISVAGCHASDIF